MRCIVTYDIKDGENDDYFKFYNFAKKTKAIKLTESAYLFNTTINPAVFLKKIKDIFGIDDNVVIIYVNSNNELSCTRI